MSSLRIIGGRWRSRRIDAPPTRRTRPMPDRVKEAVFDILGSRCGTPGVLPPLSVADLFAGSGSMGLEAVSRGASRCVFVERDGDALGVLHRNLDALQAGPGLRIVGADAWVHPLDKLRQPGDNWGVVFLDPPYRDSRDAGPGGKVAGLLMRLHRAGCVAPDGMVVLHHERGARYEPASGEGWAIDWTLADRREYGSTAVSFFGLAESRPGSGDGEMEAHADQ
ncbi:MAG: RsmD family RNA methyltransferase [Planctomycetota bacterium]